MEPSRTLSRALFAVLAVLCALATGCDDFATPAELARAQILAVRADPPAVEPGGTAVLSALVADRDGEIARPEVTWEVSPTNPGDVPMGTVAVSSDGPAVYTAPAELDEVPGVASVTLQVASEDGPLNAVKVITVGLDLSNPEITALSAAGEDRMDSGELTVQSGQLIPLEIEFTSVSSDNLFAWYSTVGEIATYQSNPVELLTQDESGSGWLFVVVRDGLGGVAWQSLQVTVE